MPNGDIATVVHIDGNKKPKKMEQKWTQKKCGKSNIYDTISVAIVGASYMTLKCSLDETMSA